MKFLAIFALIVVIATGPMLIRGQEGIGGTAVHRPDLGCACLVITDRDLKDQLSAPPRKLTERECREKGDVAKIYVGGEVDNRAVIVEQPKPEMPSLENKGGRVLLKAVLCPNGLVGRVGIVIGVSKQLNELAVDAAKKVKFKPATKEGKSVAQFVQLEYTFDAP